MSQFSVNLPNMIPLPVDESHMHRSKLSKTPIARRLSRALGGHKKPKRGLVEEKSETQAITLGLGGIGDGDGDGDDDDDLTTSISMMPWTPQYDDFRVWWFAIFDEPSSSRISFIISLFIMFVIIVSCLNFILESLPPFRFPNYGTKEGDSHPVFVQVETVCITIFTIEYITRLIFSHSISYHGLGVKKITTPKCCTVAIHKTWVFLTRWLNVIDLLAILPFYLELAFGFGNGGLAVLRILRLTRIFRIFKIGKYSDSVTLYGEVLASSAQALYLLVFFSVITSIVMGSILFFAEQGTYSQDGCWNQRTNESFACYIRPNVLGSGIEESPFTSIPQSMWWVFTTITTVGYGDLVPTTVLGKIAGTLTMNLGLLGLALPVTILGTNFARIYERRAYKKRNKDFAETQDISTFHANRLRMVSRIREIEASLTEFAGMLEQSMVDYDIMLATKKKWTDAHINVKTHGLNKSLTEWSSGPANLVDEDGPNQDENDAPKIRRAKSLDELIRQGDDMKEVTASRIEELRNEILHHEALRFISPKHTHGQNSVNDDPELSQKEQPVEFNSPVAKDDQIQLQTSDPSIQASEQPVTEKLTPQKKPSQRQQEQPNEHEEQN